MQRYCRDKASGHNVHIWTAIIAKQEQMEEVWAPDAKAAMTWPAAPRVETTNPADLVPMTKRQLACFLAFRCDVDIEPTPNVLKADLVKKICEELCWQVPELPASDLPASLQKKPANTVDTAGDPAEVNVYHVGIGSTDAG